MVRILRHIRNVRPYSLKNLRFGLKLILGGGILLLLLGMIQLYICTGNFYCQDRLIEWGKRPWYELPL